MKTKLIHALLFAAFLSSCSGKEQKIIVTNSTERSKSNETVEVSFSKLQEADSKLTTENVIILNSEKQQVPSQVYQESDGTSLLLFQVSIEKGESQEFIVKAGEREDYPTKAYSRHVPERMDDYAYENNLVAGRIYGPALAFPKTYGSDVWVKSTERLIIDEWFERGDYHHNYGEGMDCYQVGATLGGGALAPCTKDGEIVIGNNWASFEHICDGAIRTKAEFTYDAIEVDGLKYSVSRTLELDANSYFVKHTTTFHPIGHDTELISVALGAVKHDIVHRENGSHWIAYTEKASDTRTPDKDGNISIALVYDPDAREENMFMAVGDNGVHASIISAEETGKPITTWTGSSWTHAEIKTGEEWADTVRNFSYHISNPLTVSIIE